MSLLKDILATDSWLSAVHTVDTQAVADRLKILCLKEGVAGYIWVEDVGLVSFREQDFAVPGTVRITDAMRYVKQSPHYGIYVFPEVPECYSRQLTQLAHFLERKKGQERRVILIGQQITLPKLIDNSIAHIALELNPVLMPRLRGGKWVL